MLARLARLARSLGRPTRRDSNGGHIVLSCPDHLHRQRGLARPIRRHLPQTWPNPSRQIVPDMGASVVVRDRGLPCGDGLAGLARRGWPGCLARLARLARLPDAHMRQSAHDRVLQHTRGRQGRASIYVMPLGITKNTSKVGSEVRLAGLAGLAGLAKLVEGCAAQVDPAPHRLTSLAQLTQGVTGVQIRLIDRRHRPGNHRRVCADRRRARSTGS